MSLSIKIEIELASCMGKWMCALISRSENSFKDQEKIYVFKMYLLQKKVSLP